MPKTIHSLLSVFLLSVLVALPMAASYPTVTNYPRKTHGAGSQTWAITQDTIGRMYFGNKNGLLIYNSADWRLSGLPNGSTVRSFALDHAHTGRLYVGGSEDFGYFKPDSLRNKLVYTSLSHLIPPPVKTFKEVWDVHIIGTTVWFRADKDIFRYDGSTIVHIDMPDKVTASAVIDGKLYVAVSHHGLAELRDTQLVPVTGNESLSDKKICAILPFSTAIMAVTDYDGLWLADGRSLTRIPTDIDEFLMRNQVFCATVSNGKYAFGTVRNGVVIKDFTSQETVYANIETGLQNNTVLTMYFDRDENLWLGLDDGIDMLMVNSPFSNLLGSATTYGAGYMSRLHDGLLYLGTNQGLFVTPYPLAPTPRTPPLSTALKGQVWDINILDNKVFVCSDAGVSYGSGTTFRPIEGISGAWAVKPLSQHEGYALASAYDAFYILHKVGNEWVNTGPVEGYGDIGGHFTEDNKGNIWIANWLKGVYRLTIDPASRRVTESAFFNSAHGLPTDHNIGVAQLGSRLTFTSEGGFFSLAEDGETMIPNTALSEMLQVFGAARVHEAPNEDIWCVAGHRVCVASRTASGQMTVDSITYSPLADRLIPGFDDFNFISDDHVIVSSQEGFYDVNLRHRSSVRGTPTLMFSRIHANGDSIIAYSDFSGRMLPVELDYDLNSLRFEYVMPEYRAENAVLYSFYLENYDSDWSSYSTATSKEYTQLHEGHYRMHVRARNNHTHRMDESVLEFSIAPPWYRSTTAKVIYSLLMLVLLWLTYRVVGTISRRTAQRVARRKENELDDMRRQAREDALHKDYEIAELKGRQLEQDIKHKTEELSNITMNVVRKNEILLEISNRLTRLSQGELSNDITRQIGHIQSLIRENISHDDDWRNFIHNFDAAYEDFTKKLLAMHPSLTPTELRVCCYIKMGLSSKDIDPLFNISYRSVEMTRYRLRKKLGLERDVNLTDYLQRIA